MWSSSSTIVLLSCAIVPQDPARRGWIWSEGARKVAGNSAVETSTAAAKPAMIAPRPDNRWTGAPCVLGDIDGDGASEILVHTWHAPSKSARSWILSGANGVVLAAPYLDRGSFQGVALPCRRDLDDDGWVDWISWQGESTVFHSARTGDVIDTLARPRFGADWEGWSRPGGDVDGDGFQDLVVRGLPFDSDGATAAARVFSGKDGGLLFERADPELSRGWLTDLITIGDQDADGRDDLVLATWSSATRTFVVRVISSRDGTMLREHDDVRSARDCVRLRDAGDLDGDGVHDLLVASGAMLVRLYSGDGRLLFERAGEMPEPHISRDPELGYGWNTAGLVDAGGRAYVLMTVSRGLGWSGEVECWSVSGNRCAFVTRMPPEPDDWSLGARLEVCGDANADGTPDFLCWPDRSLSTNPARFYVCSGRTGAVLWSAYRTLDGIDVRR